MKKTITKVLGYVLATILIAYLIITIIIPKQAISIFGFRSFVIVSNSMEPDINVYDMIFITKTKEEKLEERDIITFLVYIPEVGHESYVTHYIGEITEDEFGNTIYKTQGATRDVGDFDEWTDSEGNIIDIQFEDIEGRYLFRIPYIGFIIAMLRDPIFVGLLIINGTIIFFIFKLIKASIKAKKEEQKKET